MCIPTLMAYASKDVGARYVAPALAGEEIWCQLFSEPAAGSDVAGLRTRAEKHGADWIVSARRSGLPARISLTTDCCWHAPDFDALKHKGLTMFFLSMRSPGVEIRPIRQASGGANFTKCFSPMCAFRRAAPGEVGRAGRSR